MIKSLLFVGLGSFCGGALRYYISALMKNCCCQGFPWATMLVNMTGCLLIGIILGLFNKLGSQSSSWCLLLTTGFCGGFTTFSAFANESVQMLQNGNIVNFISYLLASIVVGIALVALGYWLVK